MHILVFARVCSVMCSMGKWRWSLFVLNVYKLCFSLSVVVCTDSPCQMNGKTFLSIKCSRLTQYVKFHLLNVFENKENLFQ